MKTTLGRIRERSRYNMAKTCTECRFCENLKCVRFNIMVSEGYKSCDGFAEKAQLNESITPPKIKLYD